jgi:hypothetical protein
MRADPLSRRNCTRRRDAPATFLLVAIRVAVVKWRFQTSLCRVPIIESKHSNEVRYLSFTAASARRRDADFPARSRPLPIRNEGGLHRLSRPRRHADFTFLILVLPTAMAALSALPNNLA